MTDVKPAASGGSSAALPALVTRPFVLLIAAHFLQALGWSSMLLLPLHLDGMGATRTDIGVVMATASIGGLLLRPLVGWALDTIGRKPTLYAGTALLSGGIAMLALPTQISPLLYGARLVYGMGSATLFTGYFALASDIIPAQRRTEGLALFGVSGLLPLALNGYAGGLTAAAAGSDGLRSFFVGVAFCVTTSLFFLRRVPAPRLAHEGATRRGPSPVGLRHVWEGLFAQRRLWPTWLATTLFSGQVAVFFAFAVVAGRARGMADPAFIWIPYSLGAVGVRLIGARLPDRLGTSNLVAPTVATYAAAILLVAGASQRPELLVAGLLAGIAHGYAFPVITSQVVARAPAALTGTALAVFTGLWELSDLILAPTFGAVADRFDDATMFASVALAAAGGLVLWAVLEGTLARRPVGMEQPDP